MDDYISKPIREDDLRGVIDRLVFGSSAEAPPSVLPEQVTPPSDERSEQQLAVFDRADLLTRLGGNQSLLPKMVKLFITSADEHLKLLCAAASAGDSDQMRAKAHAIKGSAGNVGACALSAAAAELEKAVREGDLDRQPELLTRVEQQYDLFKQESGA